MSEMKNNTCREVWSWNRNEEMSLIEECLRTHNFISIDTEFPGCLRQTSQDASDEERYDDMSFSLRKTKLIQLGLTLFDVNGSIGGSWEINFADFGDIEDARNEKSIAFLTRNGLDLKKIREEGIGIDDFFLDLNWILKLNKNINWITFHGSYDIAYLLKGLTRESLPVTSERFSKSVARILGSVYDLKVMAGRCNGLSSRFGLESLANELGLNRVGTAHHAGSDSELTARVFAKMAKVCHNVRDSEGYVYEARGYDDASKCSYEPCYDDEKMLWTTTTAASTTVSATKAEICSWFSAFWWPCFSAESINVLKICSTTYLS